MATEAVLETLRQLWLVLSQSKVRAAVVGGLALAVWKYPRATRDVDVLLIADDSKLLSLTARLEQAGFKQKNTAMIDLGETNLLQFTFEPANAYLDVQIDLLLAKSAYAQQCLERSLTIPTEAIGIEIQVLGCEDLIVFKLLAGRVIDRVDVAALLNANADVLDQKLLEKLANEANVACALEEIRHELTQ
jgi:hypothetical protein